MTIYTNRVYSWAHGGLVVSTFAVNPGDSGLKPSEAKQYLLKL